MPRKSVESDFQWIDLTTGKPTRYFYELVKELSERSLTQRVSPTEPTNNQVLVYNATTKQYVPGAN